MILGHKHIKDAFEQCRWKAYRDGKPVGPADLTINPHSINVSLGKKIMVPCIKSMQRYIDLHDPNSLEWNEYPIADGLGYPLDRGSFILGHVRERFDCSEPLYINKKWRHFAPMIDGRSTPARCGLCVHETAGYGDLGFNGSFTLEISSQLPVRIYIGDEIAQVSFVEVSDGSVKYEGAYADQHDGPKAPVLGKDRFQRWK